MLCLILGLVAPANWVNLRLSAKEVGGAGARRIFTWLEEAWMEDEWPAGEAAFAVEAREEDEDLDAQESAEEGGTSAPAKGI